MNGSDKRMNGLTNVAVAFAVVTLVHIVAFLSDPGLKIDLDFAYLRDESPYVKIAGWTIDRGGLVAQAGQTNVLQIGLSKTRYEELLLNVIPTRQGHGKILVRASVMASTTTNSDSIPDVGEEDPPWQLEFGRPFEDLDATTLVPAKGPVDLSAVWASGGGCLIYVRPTDGASGPLIRSLHVHRRVWPWWAMMLPLFYLVLFVSTMQLRRVFEEAAVHRAAILLAVLLGLASILFPIELIALSGLIAVAALVVCCVPVFTDLDARWPVGVALAVITLLAASHRLDSLNEMRFQPLAADAQNFRVIANEMTWFYDSNHREPGVIFLIKLILTMFGNDEFQVRLFSLFFSVALVPLAFFAGKEIRSPLAGLVLALLIATNSGWIWQSARGLRLEAFSVALLLLTASVLTRRKLSATRHAVAMGLSAVLVCLLRITSLWFCLLAVVYGMLRRGWNTKSFVLSMGIVIIPLVPYWVYCGYTFGDPMYAVNHHIKFYRNLEFKDQPGFPTSGELKQDAYAGDDVTPLQFFFNRDMRWELPRRTVTQLYAIFLGNHLYNRVCDKSRILVWWAVASYFVLLFTEQRSLLLWLVILIGPIAWLFTPTTGPEWRLIFHASIFVYLAMGIALDRLVNGDQVRTIDIAS